MSNSLTLRCAARRTTALACVFLLACSATPTLAEDAPSALDTAPESQAFAEAILQFDQELLLAGCCDDTSCDCGSGCGSGCDCGSSCDCGSGCTGGSGCCSCRQGSPYYGVIDFVAYSRDNDSTNLLLLEDGAGDPLLFTDDLTFNYAPGVRARIGKYNGPCHHCDACEIEYLGIFDWDASAQITNLDNIFLPGALGAAVNGFQTMDQVDLRYNAQLHSLELNCVQCCCDCCCTRIESLCGLRYISFNEQFTLASNNFSGAPAVDATYNVDTENNLFGAQIGTRLRRKRAHGWGYECTWKAGLYGNSAHQSRWVVDDIGATPVRIRQTGASEGNIAFVGELNFVPTYQINNTWAFRCGYNILWIEGLALAPEQLDFSDAPGSGTTIDTSGGLFAHGVNIGFEGRF